jgi:hypothetical protein
VKIIDHQLITGRRSFKGIGHWTAPVERFTAYGLEFKERKAQFKKVARNTEKREWIGT